MKIDFKMEKGEDRGCYYDETDRILIYPFQHENLLDLLYTITHELLHHAMRRTEETLDNEQEEVGIYYVQWADEFIV